MSQLSSRILNMKFMKNENSSSSDNKTSNDDNWQISTTLGDALDIKVNPIISAYKKPQSLVKKIYENARRTSNKSKKEAVSKEIKTLEPESVDLKSFRRNNKIRHNKNK